MDLTQEQIIQISDLFNKIINGIDPQSEEPVIEDGRYRWEGILTILGTQAGNLDPRLLKTVTWADLPLTLYAQTKNEGGHDGADIVGNIDDIWIDGNNVYGTGLFDDSELGNNAVQLVENGSLQGISVDLRDGEVDVKQAEDGSVEQIIWKEARIGGATLVGLPAFENARIQLACKKKGDTRAVASVGAHKYPAKYFSKIKYSSPSRLSISDDGEVTGHLVTWGSKHRGQGQELWTAKPTGDKRLHDFNIGTTLLDDGTSVASGILTSEGFHAGDHRWEWSSKEIGEFVQAYSSSMKELRHMEDVRSQFAQVVAWEDDFGVAVHGQIQPWVSPEEATRALAGCTSIDTRYGKIMGAHFVNVCGFVPPPIEQKDEQGNYARLVASIGPAGEEECADCEKEAQLKAQAQTSEPSSGSNIVNLKAFEELDQEFNKAEMSSILAKLKNNS